jgi:hypothetical protein
MHASLISADPAAAGLDQGEKDLISRLFTEKGIWYACTPDKAGAASMFRLGLALRMIALETLADLAGMRRLKFRDNFTRRWLQAVKASLQLGHGTDHSVSTYQVADPWLRGQ